MYRIKLLLFILIVTGIKLKAQVWENVGTNGIVSDSYASFPHVAIDNQNNYYVSYYEGSTTSGAVKWFNNGQWSFLGSNGSTVGAMYNTASSIVIDKNNVPYLIHDSEIDYTDFSISTLIEKYENGQWVSLPKLINGSSTFPAAFSRTNQLVFASTAGSGLVFKYNGVAWDTIGMPGFDKTGGIYFLDMVLDSLDNVYVSYVGWDNNIYVLKNNLSAGPNNEWTTVGPASFIAGSTSEWEKNSAMAIDNDGNLFVGYISSYLDGSKVTVLKFNGTEWKTVGDANFTPCIAKFLDLTITNSGKLYAVYSNADDYTLTRNYVVTFDESSAQWANVGTGFISEGSASFNHITVDKNNNVLIAYTDSKNNDQLQLKKLNSQAIAPDSLKLFVLNNLEPVISVDNGTLQVSATVYPIGATRDINWTIIEGENKVTISDAGLLTAITNNGAVTIKASSANSPSVFDTLTVMLTNQVSDTAPESIMITATEMVPDIFNIGSTLQLHGVVFPEVADQFIEWTIADGNGVASVDANGLVTGLADGFATIRAKSVTDPDIYSYFNVAVIDNGLYYGTVTDHFLYGVDITTETAPTFYADDFIVDEGKKFEARKMRLTVLAELTEIFTTADITFMTDENNNPGNIIKAYKNLPILSKKLTSGGSWMAEYEIEFNLPEAVTLSDGKYWIQPEVSSASDTKIYWALVPSTLGSKVKYSDGLNNWLPFDFYTTDGVFTIEGKMSDINVDVAVSRLGLNTARLTPKTQVSGEHSLTLSVANKGSETARTKLTVNKNDNNIYTDSIVLSGKESKNLNLTIDLGEIKEATTVDLVTSISAPNDEILSNNSGYNTIGISDSTFVADYADEANSENGVGSNSGSIYMGTVFEVLKPASLTSVNIMFVENANTQNEEFAFRVYKVAENDTVNHNSPVVEEVLVRGLGGDAANYPISPVKLDAGKYVFGVAQLNATNIGINVDLKSSGIIYLLAGDTLIAYPGFGAVHIRPNFGGGDISVDDNQAGFELTLYPNPAVDQCNITSQVPIDNIEVYSVTGELISTKPVASKKVHIETGNLDPGVYFIKVKTLAGSHIVNLIITK